MRQLLLNLLFLELIDLRRDQQENCDLRVSYLRFVYVLIDSLSLLAYIDRT